MGKIDELIAELCPDGVEYRKLGELAEYVTNKIEVVKIDPLLYTGVENLINVYGGRNETESIPQI